MGDDEEKQPPMTKKIRSLPPDIVVEVGTGEAMREFDCYKAALCFASPVFDLMFSNDMVGCNRLQFRAYSVVNHHLWI